jgi:hypothetical protein
MSREQDGLAERTERADELPRGSSRGGVEAGRRLVEEDELRVADERDAEVEPALLPAREHLHPGIRLVGEADQLDHLVDVPRHGVVAGEHPVDLAHGEGAGQLRVLENDADPLAMLAAAAPRVDAEHTDVALVARAVALEDLDRRRLPRAVRPEQTEDLPRVHVEVDPPDRLDAVVGLDEAADHDRAVDAAHTGNVLRRGRRPVGWVFVHEHVFHGV